MYRPAILCLALFASAASLADFDYNGDVSIRLDDTSDRSSRSQYRLRFNPRYDFGNGWSVHGFVSTGAEFDSAYSTIDDNDDEIHVRRLFMRYERGGSKLEAGVIPPYKGRVSSTGLSKEGWIRGLRSVWGTEDGAFEIVAGDLEDLRASRALSGDFDLNYIEVEYSGQLNETWSFELGGEELFDDRFLRGEIRYLAKSGAYWALELIHNTSTSNSKAILSTLRDLEAPQNPIEWFVYYSYTATGFGPRAELSEDFLEVGHAIATRLKGAIPMFERLEWFTEIELYEDTARIKAGFELSLN